MNGRNGSLQVRTVPVPTDVKVSDPFQMLGAESIGIGIGTFASGVITATANVYLQVSNTNTTSTFKRLQIMGVYSASSGIADWEVPSSTGNRVYQLPRVAGAYRYGRVELSNTATATINVDVFSST